MTETSSLVAPSETSTENFTRRLRAFRNTPFETKRLVTPSLGVDNTDFLQIAIDRLEIDIQEPTHRHQVKGATPDQDKIVEFFETNEPNTYLEVVTHKEDGVLTRQLVKAKLEDRFKIKASS
jgi:hypothetical protein